MKVTLVDDNFSITLPIILTGDVINKALTEVHNHKICGEWRPDLFGVHALVQTVLVSLIGHLPKAQKGSIT